MGRRFAFPSEAATFTNDTEADVSVVDAIWNVIAAMPPLAIAVVSKPDTIQRMSPGEINAQITDLLAALAAVPIV